MRSSVSQCRSNTRSRPSDAPRSPGVKNNPISLPFPCASTPAFSRRSFSAGGAPVVTRNTMPIMRAHPAKSEPVNAVPSHSAENTVALTGSTAPSRLPCTEPTIDTPCR